MTTLYLDCFAGAAGDMIVASLVDVGADAAALEAALRGLGIDKFDLTFSTVDKCGVQATKFDVTATDDHHQRSLTEILAIIDGSTLSETIRARSKQIFTRLGVVEAAIHGVALDDVHFHEVGAVDAIVDIVGAVVAMDLLGIDRVVSSPLPLGSGTVRTAHGIYPVPAPATARLVEGVPTYGSAMRGEVLTPTGAAIITTVASSYGPIPPGTILAGGYGAGTRDCDYPNVVRAILIDETEAHTSVATVIEANIDDMNPQHFEVLMARLLDAGALDVGIIAMLMKKGRPGSMLHVLAPTGAHEKLVDIIFTESTTIGVRSYRVEREMLDRELVTVATPFGDVRVKVARRLGFVMNRMPEYEDCRRVAEAAGVPIKVVTAAAVAALGDLR